MKVAVSGGTGFVGQEIVARLRGAGHSLRLLVRKRDSPVARAVEAQYDAELVEGCLLDGAWLSKALYGVDAMIHLVGIIGEIGDQTFENVHTRLTRSVVGAAEVAGVRRFLHMSALGTRPNAASRYHQTKWTAEQSVSQSRLDWTIFRPSLIHGPRDQFVNLFARMANSAPVLPVMGEGHAVFQPVAVEDVARCFVYALTEPRAAREIFDVCGLEKLTLPEMLQAILTATGRKKRIVRIPIGLARTLAACLEFSFPKFLGKPAPLSRDQLIMLQENNTGNGDWTAELFGLRQIPFAEGIARYLKREV